jgi:hypothetical protein
MQCVKPAATAEKWPYWRYFGAAMAAIKSQPYVSKVFLQKLPT